MNYVSLERQAKPALQAQAQEEAQCVTPNPTEPALVDGAVIYAHWSTDAAAETGLIALRMSLQRRGWRPYTAAYLRGQGSSSQLLLTAVPSASPYTKGKNDPAHTQLQLKNLQRCLQLFEIEANGDLLDIWSIGALLGAVEAS